MLLELLMTSELDVYQPPKIDDILINVIEEHVLTDIHGFQFQLEQFTHAPFLTPRCNGLQTLSSQHA
ncbi:unnamed protein product [Schistosoma rodhaini]|uniref:Uncharacterized protein n=1 Tax=Schistosoma rodhaini TaxID=6188 RepID=A0AA85G492_9TREM|nr:unnamed protein product [Schistosoma rodhaini]CAH8594813.1 unnamed protein product [Schistosoma rodhaini]